MNINYTNFVSAALSKSAPVYERRANGDVFNIIAINENRLTFYQTLFGFIEDRYKIFSTQTSSLRPGSKEWQEEFDECVECCAEAANNFVDNLLGKIENSGFDDEAISILEVAACKDKS
ncbi:hypothetical protein GOV04_04565 [Candidatus Woesearchaeota archaeon]|nr:hypothetical protein [Candidatus Woesearchaeota archaeon]